MRRIERVGVEVLQQLLKKSYLEPNVVATQTEEEAMTQSSSSTLLYTIEREEEVWEDVPLESESE